MTILEIETLAKRMVEQWEKHDKFRTMEGDEILFTDGKQPDDILICKTLIESLKVIRVVRDSFNE